MQVANKCTKHFLCINHIYNLYCFSDSKYEGLVRDCLLNTSASHLSCHLRAKKYKKHDQPTFQFCVLQLLNASFNVHGKKLIWKNRPNISDLLYFQLTYSGWLSLSRTGLSKFWQSVKAFCKTPNIVGMSWNELKNHAIYMLHQTALKLWKSQDPEIP